MTFRVQIKAFKLQSLSLQPHSARVFLLPECDKWQEPYESVLFTAYGVKVKIFGKLISSLVQETEIFVCNTSNSQIHCKKQ